MVELKCGTKIKWHEPYSLSIKEGIIVNETDYYDVAESGTGLFYNVREKDIEFVNVDGTWISCESYENKHRYLKSDENAASKLRNTFDNNRDMVDSMVYGVCNYLDRIGMRRSGRYPWNCDTADSIKNFIDSNVKTYIENDRKATYDFIKSSGRNCFEPKKVIFNDPATIVIWNDGTKTIVKRREGEPDDKEKAIMYCILKKLCGNKATMDRYLKLFLKEEESNEEKEKAGSSKSDWKKPRARSGCSEGTV